MKKKLLSLALSLALSLSLTVPALAYEDTDPPQWKEYGYSSLEEMLTDWEMSEEEYYESVVAEMLEYERQERERIAAFAAAYPELYASFNPYAYFAEEYFFFDSPEEYMELYGLTEEGFRQEMTAEWIWHAERMVEEKTAAGGSVTGINVMVNGQCIPFSDARPEIKNDRTMVPMAAALEYLGAEAAYDAGEHAAYIALADGGAYLYHKIGTSELIITSAQPGGSEPEDMEVQTIQMDASSYIQNGRTMVPIAFFAQCLGYEVFWDSEYQTAVLLDRESAAALIDEEFTLLNRVLYTLSGQEQKKVGQALRGTLELDLELTMLDSLHGDKTYTFTMEGEELAGDAGASLEYRIDLGDLFTVLMELDGWYGYDEEELGQLETYRDLLSDLPVEAIWDKEGMCIYVRSPILAQLELVEDPEAWAVLPMSGLEELAALETGELTLGNLLVTLAFADPYQPFLAWSEVMAPVEMLGSVVGDGCFNKSGASYVMEWDLGELDSYYMDEDTSFTAGLTITPVGERSCSYALAMEADSSYFAASLDLTGADGRMDLEGDLHVKNMLKAILALRSRVSASGQQPPIRPDDGDKLEHPAGMLGMGNLDELDFE